MTNVCPVCGYPNLKDPPRFSNGGASDEICPSCGFQFGFSDDSEGITYEQWRNTWVAGGMIWRGRKIKPPANWNPREQLKTVIK